MDHPLCIRFINVRKLTITFNAFKQTFHSASNCKGLDDNRSVRCKATRIRTYEKE